MSFGPTISVIIPTYNRPDELKRLLMSVEQQTYPANEIIVVDASIKSLPLDSDNYISISSDRGLVTQRNKGIKEAKGDIIVFIDDDAILTPSCLEVIAREFAGDDSNEIGALTGRIIDGENKNQNRWNLARLFLLGESKGAGKFKISCFPSLSSGERDKEAKSAMRRYYGVQVYYIKQNRRF